MVSSMSQFFKKSIRPMDGNLRVSTTLVPSGSGSNSNEGILHISPDAVLFVCLFVCLDL